MGEPWVGNGISSHLLCLSLGFFWELEASGSRLAFMSVVAAGDCFWFMTDYLVQRCLAPCSQWSCHGVVSSCIGVNTTADLLTGSASSLLEPRGLHGPGSDLGSHKAPADPEAGQPLRLQEQRLNTYAESSFINADLILSPRIVPQPLRA